MGPEGPSGWGQSLLAPSFIQYLSARARASGSVGGITKQMAGAVSLFPALSVRSQLSPLLLCRV